MGSYIKIPRGSNSGISDPIHPLTVVAGLFWIVAFIEFCCLLIMLDSWPEYKPPTPVTYEDTLTEDSSFTLDGNTQGCMQISVPATETIHMKYNTTLSGSNCISETNNNVYIGYGARK